MNHPAIFPGLDVDQQDSAQVAALAGSQVHPDSALPSRTAAEWNNMLSGDDLVLIPRGLIGAACYAVRKLNPESKLLPKLREYTTGDKSTRAPASNWRPASTPPDADTTVMLAMNDGEVWQGYWNGEDWIEVSGLKVSGRVKYWQHNPRHPEDQE